MDGTAQSSPNLIRTTAYNFSVETSEFVRQSMFLFTSPPALADSIADMMANAQPGIAVPLWKDFRYAHEIVKPLQCQHSQCQSP